jgi:hypothetical protein
MEHYIEAYEVIVLAKCSVVLEGDDWLLPFSAATTASITFIVAQK